MPSTHAAPSLARTAIIPVLCTALIVAGVLALAGRSKQTSVLAASTPTPSTVSVDASEPLASPPSPVAKAVPGREYGPAVAVKAESHSNPVTVALPPPTTTTTRPVVTVAAPAVSTACGGWQAQVAKLWPPGSVGTACRILLCESGGNPRAHNASGASGLMQLMPLHDGRFQKHGWSYYNDVYDGWKNLVVAHDLYSEAGWRPWSCR